ncbi:MAG: hypothetical protein SPJ53_02545 [Lactobacillus amylovorus]|nr:hypothetical protein [Lactobacillus amylovorus]
MIKLQGILVNMFKTQAGTTKKGEQYESKEKVQILGNFELPNGQTKNELVDLTVDNIALFEPFKGKVISLDIGVISSGKNVVFYARKGAKPVLADMV